MSPSRDGEHEDPPQWIDLDTRTQVNLCCDLIEADSAWLLDAITDIPVPDALAHLRAMNDAKLGRCMRRAVMELCRNEVERRLARGDFLP